MTTKARNPVLAALGSLTLPGMGQVYNGQPLLAGGFALGYLILSLFYMARLFGGLSEGSLEAAIGHALGPLALMLLLWLGSVVQAVFAALNRPDYLLQPYNRGLVYFGLYLACYLILPLVGGGPAMRWALARNGIVTAEQRTEWLARVGALREGQAVPAIFLDSTPSVPTANELDLRDPEADFAGAPTAIHLVLVGGRDGGIYDMASAEPTCTLTGDGWTNLYANPSDSTGVTAIQLRIPVESGETSKFDLSVNVGNAPEGRRYEVDTSPDAPGTPPRAAVVRRGGEVVLRLTGTTQLGVRIEATVQCRQIVEPAAGG